MLELTLRASVDKALDWNSGDLGSNPNSVNGPMHDLGQVTSLSASVSPSVKDE